MSSPTGLNDAQLRELDSRLTDQLAQLESEIAEESDAVVAGRSERFPSGARDHGDEAQRGERDEIDGEVLARHRQEASEIRAALNRFQDGSYGECVSCGGSIGYERLMVQPRAARCMVCQTRAEKR